MSCICSGRHADVCHDIPALRPRYCKLNREQALTDWEVSKAGEVKPYQPLVYIAMDVSRPLTLFQRLKLWWYRLLIERGGR